MFSEDYHIGWLIDRCCYIAGLAEQARSYLNVTKQLHILRRTKQHVKAEIKRHLASILPENVLHYQLPYEDRSH